MNLSLIVLPLLMSLLSVKSFDTKHNPIIMSHVTATIQDSILNLETFVSIYNNTSDTCFYLKKIAQETEADAKVLNYFDRRIRPLKQKNKYEVDPVFSSPFECDSLIMIPPGQTQIVHIVKQFYVAKNKKKHYDFQYVDEIILGACKVGSSELSETLRNGGRIYESACLSIISVTFQFDRINGTVNYIKNSIYPYNTIGN